jgi:hypothetical protein
MKALVIGAAIVFGLYMLCKTWKILAVIALVVFISTTAHAEGRSPLRIGFEVTTASPTLVRAHWTVTCSTPTATSTERGITTARTDFRRSLDPTLPDATCSLRVVAWNVGHPHGQTPIVRTWVR